jgi:TRAP-type C4-dicarboxylate transport system substrate-binding protein
MHPSAPAGAKAASRIFLFLSMALLLAACGGGDPATESAGDTPGGTETLAINLGGTSTPNTPGESMWLNFKQAAEAASGGQLELKPLIYGQLGSEEQLLSGIRRGRIQFANLSAQVTSTLVPELSVLYTPYLFADEAEADYIYDTHLTDLYRELLAEQGLHLVTWYEIGFHSVYGKQPILTPDDMQGRRFRVSASTNARLFAEALGADLIPLGFGEIVPSLQTGLVDAGENSISLYARTGISAEAPHLTLTRHVFGVSVIVADKAWWDGLPPATREILRTTFPAIEESRAEVRAQDVADLADPELGIQSYPLSDEERAAWQAQTVGVAERLLEQIGGRSREIYELIMRAKAEYANLQ